MNIIIAGDGQVGATLTRQFSNEGYDVTVIDSNSELLESSVERYDVISVHGNCASMPVLMQAGVMDADLLIAVTNQDEINLLCCTTAHSLNPRLHTIARVRNPDYTDQIYRLRDVFGLSMVVNPENQAATEIRRLLKYPGFLRRDTFAKGRTEIVELRVDAESKLCNVKLMDLRNIVKCQVLVCAVLRGGNAIAPNGEFMLRAGDRIFVTALSENLTTLLNNLGIITRRVRRVLVCGGGRVGYYLAKLLETEGIRVKIMDNDMARCHELSELLPSCDIICGDIRDQDILESEGITQCDALCTLSSIDELNIIVSMYASSLKVPQIITKLQDTSRRSIVDSLSLGSVISPKELCAENIIRYVRAMQHQSGAAISVHSIADGQLEALEFRIDEASHHCGTPLKQLKLKPNVLIASISHGAVNEIANGDSVYNEGDTIVVVSGNQSVIRQFNDIFA